jgi:ATP-dependent protease HslVU (ClpYQ) ATPase subunit
VGKTYLVKHIAELIGVPFVKADATKFSETGLCRR